MAALRKSVFAVMYDADENRCGVAMSIEKVKSYFKGLGLADKIMEFDASSATVELAALAVGVEPARIAKTLSFKEQGEDDGCLLIVAAGDVKVDNAKFKHNFGFKAKMLTPDEVGRLTGHQIGGVCPFANPEGTSAFLDESLKRFGTVFPACGSANSAIELGLDDLFKYSGAKGWIDVCKPKE